MRASEASESILAKEQVKLQMIAWIYMIPVMKFDKQTRSEARSAESEAQRAEQRTSEASKNEARSERGYADEGADEVADVCLTIYVTYKANRGAQRRVWGPKGRTGNERSEWERGA